MTGTLLASGGLLQLGPTGDQVQLAYDTVADLLTLDRSVSISAGLTLDPPSGAALIATTGKAAFGLNGPSPETSLHVRTAIDHNFGVLVDASGVPGSEIGLHTSQAEWASLAKNAFFSGSQWQRFNTAGGAFLLEVEQTGEVNFKLAPAGSNPIAFRQVASLTADGSDLTVATDFLKLPVMTGAGTAHAPDAADCDAVGEAGRVVYNRSTNELWICNGAAWASH